MTGFIIFVRNVACWPSNAFVSIGAHLDVSGF